MGVEARRIALNLHKQINEMDRRNQLFINTLGLEQIHTIFQKLVLNLLSGINELLNRVGIEGCYSETGVGGLKTPSPAFLDPEARTRSEM